jgi:hypothetical protein
VPDIKVKKNSITLYNDNEIRNKEVISQIKDLFKWKKKRNYGQRWMAKAMFFHQEDLW